jgi:hypothetical protein
MAPATDPEILVRVLFELTFDSPVKLPTRRETTRRDMKLRNFRRENARSKNWKRAPYDNDYQDFVLHQTAKKHTPRKGHRRHQESFGDENL